MKIVREVYGTLGIGANIVIPVKPNERLEYITIHAPTPTKTYQIDIGNRAMYSLDSTNFDKTITGIAGGDVASWFFAGGLFIANKAIKINNVVGASGTITYQVGITSDI